MKRLNVIVALWVALWAAGAAGPALAWGGRGHQEVGSIADQLLNDRAKAMVNKLLGYDLRTAATWADCVRSVAHPKPGTWTFTVDPKHPEYTASCLAFETDAERTRMEDYAKRNWDNCDRAKGQGCHTAYHFADVPVTDRRYDRGAVGASDHDVVSTLQASIMVLKGEALPPFFIASDQTRRIKDQKEALLLITHLVGDLHQPLHVGTEYLDPETGAVLDPGAPGFDAKAGNAHGGNDLLDKPSPAPVKGKKPAFPSNLHHDWDSVSSTFGLPAKPDIIAAARAVAPSAEPLEQWPAQWASESIVAAAESYRGLTFTPTSPRGQWVIDFTARPDYAKDRAAMQEARLAKGGARLAQLLNTIWP